MKSSLSVVIAAVFAVPLSIALFHLTHVQEILASNSHADHASLVAYPNSVIATKDPKTQMFFYVESNGRNLVGLGEDGSVKWMTDVMSEINTTQFAGSRVIRHLSMDNDILLVTRGRNQMFMVDPTTGESQRLASDGT